MKRSSRLRALLLLGLALLLGGLAAHDIAAREADLTRRVGPLTPVVVAQADIAADAEIGEGDLAIRQIPSRFAPENVATDPGDVIGLKPLVNIAQGSYLSSDAFGSSDQRGPDVRKGERIAEVSAVGDLEQITAGSRVDVVITADSQDGDSGRSRLALEDVQVLAAAPDESDVGSVGSGQERGGPRLRVALRVGLSDAIYLTTADNYAREIRLLPRPAGDRRHHPGISTSLQE